MNMDEMTDEMLAERQHVLDVDKWLASEAAGYDLCGSFTFCARCDKTETHPCARAEARHMAELEKETEQFEEEEALLEENEDIPAEDAAEEEEIAAAEAPDDDEEEPATAETPAAADESEIPAGYEWVTRYRRSFKSRLIQNEKMQDFYTEVRNALSELAGLRSRVSQACENFRFHGDRIARLSVGGKTLTLYLALDPDAYEDTKYRYEDVSDRKTYAETPMKVRVTSKRMVKYAKELIADLAAKHEVPVVGHIPMDYHAPFEDDAALIKKGLIKPYNVLVKKKKK